MALRSFVELRAKRGSKMAFLQSSAGVLVLRRNLVSGDQENRLVPSIQFTKGKGFLQNKNTRIKEIPITSNV